MVKWLMDWWLVLTTPEVWPQRHPYSEKWDVELNRLMREHKFKREWGHRTARLGPAVVYAERDIYSFPCDPFGVDIRPKRSTLVRAKRKMHNDLADSFLEWGETVHADNS